MEDNSKPTIIEIEQFVRKGQAAQEAVDALLVSAQAPGITNALLEIARAIFANARATESLVDVISKANKISDESNNIASIMNKELRSGFTKLSEAVAQLRTDLGVG